MPTKRIYELAKDYKISSNALLSVLKELGFEPKSHMSVAVTNWSRQLRRSSPSRSKKSKRRWSSKPN